MTPPSPGRGRMEEAAFHRWLKRTFPRKGQGLLPIGDDAAALRPPPGRVAVLTTDSLVEGYHFLPRSAPSDVGTAAARVSLSDLAAKGARPAALLLSLVLPPGSPRSWAEAVARGADRGGRAFGAPLVGGDTKAGPARVVVSTALGWGNPERLAPRTGARAGDVVVTTGSVGRGGWAYERYRRRSRRRAETLRLLLELRPRVREGAALVRWCHALLDTSDGLADSARLVAESSRVRIEVEEARLPWEPSVRRLAPATRRRVAFFGGDYELFGTLAPESLPGAGAAVRSVGGRLTPIGTVRRGSGAFLVRGGRTTPMPSGSWRPFAMRGRLSRAVNPA